MDIEIEKGKWYMIYYVYNTYIMKADMCEKNSPKSFTSSMHIDIKNLGKVYKMNNTAYSHNNIRLATQEEILKYLPDELKPYKTHDLWI